MKSAQRIWILQLLWAFLGGLPFLLVPRRIMESTTVIVGTTIPRIAADIPLIEVDQVRMVGAASMGLCLATALAVTRQTLAWQRGMAAIFLVFMLQWSSTLTFNQATGHYASFVPWLTVVPALVFAGLNLLILLQWGSTPPAPRSRLDAAPARLRWLWGLQGVWYLVEAGVCLFAAGWVLSWLTGTPGGASVFSEIARQQVRIVSAWTLTLALFSLYASVDHRIRDWRQYRWPFLLALVIRAGAVWANERSGTIGFWPAVTLSVPALLFAVQGFAWTLGAAPSEFREGHPAKQDEPPPATASVAWLWLLQLLLLTGLGLACVFAPGTLLGWMVAAPEISLYASDGMRLAGSLLLGLALFTIYALMMSRSVYRRRFAAAFAFGFAVLGIALWLAFASRLYAGAAAFAAAVLGVLALANLVRALQTPPGARRQDDAGIAGSKPASSFLAWLAQLLLLVAGGVALLFATDAVLSYLSGGVTPKQDEALMRLVRHQWQLVGVLGIAVAALTLVALTSERERIWRGFAFFSSLCFVLFSVALGFVIFTARYDYTSAIVWVPGLAFVVSNWWIRRRPETWSTADISEDIETWTVLDLVAGPLMALSVLLTGRRSSHLVGVGARGRFRVADNVPVTQKGTEGFPCHDFFEARREFPVQVRFANLTESDDAALDVRGCSIKFSEHRYESPLDLLMNTGSYCPAFNLWTFAAFVLSKFLPAAVAKRALRTNLVAREGGVAGLRRGPDSYAHLHYHSQIVRHWVDRGGVRHLVRYRCVPAESGPESGLPSAEEAARMWERERLPGDTRPQDYLRQELYERVAGEGVTMHLEAQFHRLEPGDSDDWYNASVDWDEGRFPWVPLGRLALDAPLGPVETERLLFDPSNHPLTLGIPRSKGPGDFRSMGDSEARVVRALQRLRVWMYDTSGLPSLAQFPALRRDS